MLEAARRRASYPRRCAIIRAKPPMGACRLCLVEIEKQRVLQPACTFPVAEGLVVQHGDTQRLAASAQVRACNCCSPNAATIACSARQRHGAETPIANCRNWRYRYGHDRLGSIRPTTASDWPVDASRKYFAAGPQPLHPVPALHAGLR